MAGMIRLILERGWEDRRIHCKARRAVRRASTGGQPFTPEYVSQRADVPMDAFVALTETFATTKRGRAESGTGANMGPHSNLVAHLVQCLNIVCGRLRAEGERIGNPGVLTARYPRPCQVMPATRSWDKGYKEPHPGLYGLIVGELPTRIMSDEILDPAPEQVKAFFVHGGNPAVIVPDQQKVVRAFGSLELLVTVDPFMTPTAKLSDYVLPTVMQYERQTSRAGKRSLTSTRCPIRATRPRGQAATGSRWRPTTTSSGRLQSGSVCR